MQRSFGSGLSGKTTRIVFSKVIFVSVEFRHVRVIRAYCSVTSLDSPYIRSTLVPIGPHEVALHNVSS